MKYYLLDYENVNASGLDGISDLSEDCKIVLFYTRNSNKIDLGIFNVLRNMKAEISIIEVHHGKQALDIQLASYLGYLIGTEPEDTEYYIISKDKGYRNVQSFWPERRIVLCRNLSPDSEIIDEPSPKKSSSKSGSRGGRKSSSAKAAEPEKASEPAKAAEPAKATEPAESPAPAEAPKSKAKSAKSSANAKAKDKPAAEEKPADEPKPNAFAEAAAIAKAVVEAKKARNAAAEKKDPAAPEEAPAKKEPAKKASAKKAPAKKSAAKKESAKKEAAKKEPAKKEPAKKEAAKKSPAKQKDSDMRNEVNNEIQKRLSKEGIPGDIINSTASFVSKNIGKDGYKQTIYRGIIKEHGQKMGLTIYRLIKDLL